MDFKQIQELIKIVSESDLSVLKIEQENFKITLKKGVMPGRAQQPPAHAHITEPAAIQQIVPDSALAATPDTKTISQEKTAEEDKYITIKSPMVGTFYRSPAPDKEPFVKVGDIIHKGDHICIIEAMKLFNEIESEYDGRVMKVLVEDAQPVEYDQPLFLIEPA